MLQQALYTNESPTQEELSISYKSIRDSQLKDFKRNCLPFNYLGINHNFILFLLNVPE